MLRLRTAVETAKSWRRFVAGLATDPQALRPEIRDSWLRSKAAGVDPRANHTLEARATPQITGRKPAPQSQASAGKAQAGSLCHADARLLAAGKPELARVARALAGQHVLAVLANAEAQVLALEVAGKSQAESLCHTSPPSPALRRKASELAARELKALAGLRLTEREAGTNCVGLALHLAQPVEVVWHENYAAWAHRWAGCAAPIGGPGAGPPAGVIAIIGWGGAPARETPELARSAAHAVASRLREAELTARLQVLEEFTRQQSKFPERAILALSADGRILGFSPAMGKLLGEGLAPRALGQRISELSGVKVEGELAPIGDVKPYEAALQLRYKSGAERAVASMIFPLASEAGEGLRAGFLLAGSGSSAAAGRPHGARSSWQANYGPADFVGESQAAKQVLELTGKAAGYDWPVFMVGESGTGKELLAGAIHGLGPRASGPFVALDCSTMPHDLVASELFGYEEGTFTGGQRGGKPGKLELADGGTLFLDELADLPLNVQVGLLRFLEDRKVIPLGGRRVKTVDVRVIAAINTDPARAIAQGKLRFDLYYRLSVFKIVVPPLRERLEDIALLARHLLDREGFVEAAFSADALAALNRHPWPGNVRELRNVVLRAAASCSGRLIAARDLMIEADLSGTKERAPANRRSGGIDKEQLLQALEHCGWNKTHAARLLSVHWVTLHRMMQRLGVVREDGAEAERRAKLEGESAEREASPSGESARGDGRGDAGYGQRGAEAKLRQTTAAPAQPRLGPLKWRR